MPILVIIALLLAVIAFISMPLLILILSTLAGGYVAGFVYGICLKRAWQDNNPLMAWLHFFLAWLGLFAAMCLSGWLMFDSSVETAVAVSMIPAFFWVWLSFVPGSGRGKYFREAYDMRKKS